MDDQAQRRVPHLVKFNATVTATGRAAQKDQKPAVLWLTGLSGAGKSTIADALDKLLNAAGRHTYILDGDNIRLGLNSDLGFSESDRVENIRRVAEVARLMSDAGLIVIVCLISPYRSERQRARERVPPGDFIEIFVDTPLGECVARDPKGLYARAITGEIPNFTGISARYEPPAKPEIHLRTMELHPVQMALIVENYLNQREKSL